MVPQFVDLSVFQPENIDWQAYKAWSSQGDGISRVALRSSYGVGYQDQHFAAYRAGALSAGIDVLILYHYAYPQYNAAAYEASSQKQIVGSIRAQDILVLDFEEDVSQATAEWAYEWLASCEANYGKLPGIYASSAFIAQRLQDTRLAQFPLWLANWQYTPNERPACPPPWASYEFVQYTDKATNIPGIQGTVDASIFLGQKEETTMIDLTTPGVSTFFKASGSMWLCTNGYIVGGAILDWYKAFGGSDQCGITHAGLPLSNEIGLGGGRTMQRFERLVAFFDPQRAQDQPAGLNPSTLVYTAHIDKGPGQDPRVEDLQTEVTALASQVAALQPGALALQNTALQAKIAQAVKDLLKDLQ
jgi:GH25 family lysozyme M1 (1,4-beta-N-acetylmuramidase)